MVPDRKLPDGTVTLLMTDIEGSTRQWERLGDDFVPLLEEHNRLIRKALSGHGGLEVKTEGDSFFFVFKSAPAALAGAIEIQKMLTDAGIGLSVRVGLHTGAPALRHNDYFGPQVNRTARIRDAAYGGQVLLSEVTYELCKNAPVPDAQIVDRGEHRLRDLGMPVRLFQAQPAGMPADHRTLRTLDTRPNNLPAYRTSFVGRQHELGIVHELLLHPNAHLVILTGPGGCGKTRLALQAAADHMANFPDGIWFVALVDVDDTNLLLPEIATVVLGAQTSTDPMSDLIARLAGKRVLLVLDGFDHMLPAAPQIDLLLSRLPGLRCMITSRSLLHLTAEYEFSVPSLTDAESVQLFVERAQAVRTSVQFDDSGLHTAALICQQLDGLPLAIELAAARVRGMTTPQIERRLERRLDLLSGGGRDVPDRQKTMRAVLDWSYNLLPESDRRLFSELSVFAGGFFLEAAEEVLQDPNTLEGIYSLRDHSLLVASEELGEIRFRMLGLIREYAAAYATDLNAITERHALYYLRLAREWGARARGPEQQLALKRLDQEFANFEATLRWAHEHDHPEMVAEMANTLGEYAFARGRVTPAVLAYVQAAVDALSGQVESAAQADLLLTQGTLLWLQQQYAESKTCVDASLEYYLDHDMHGHACRSLNLSGLIAAGQGRINRARALLEEGLAIATQARGACPKLWNGHAAMGSACLSASVCRALRIR